MKAALQSYAKRIDALSLRERVILFASGALVLVALADTLVLSPALTERKQIAASVAKHATELQTLRAQLSSAGLPEANDTPQGRLLTQIATAQQERNALEHELRSHSVSTNQRARLPHLLERVLRRHERLTLVAMVTSKLAPSSAAAGDKTLHWQGVDLSVSGAYLDLMNYLRELEQAMPDLHWGELRISTENARPLMNVQLLLLGDFP